MTAPRVALLTISDRPDLLEPTLRSLARACGGTLGARSPSAFVEHVHVDDQAHALGFGGAIRRGWGLLRASSVAFDYVLHVEDDWHFTTPLELPQMTAILDVRREHARPPILAPDLAQIALRRQAVSPAEVTAGGVVELWPDAYTETVHTIVPPDPAGAYEVRYLEHELFFTTNPSVYRRDLLELGWPDTERSEAAFTARCRDAGYRFAYYGGRAEPPRVWHCGDNQRQGRGY